MKDRGDDSDCEFEDALDNLSSTQKCDLSRTVQDRIDFSAGMSPTNEFAGSQFNTIGTHSTSVLPSSSSTSEQFNARPVPNTTRHGRLAMLRNRMRQEFGQPIVSEDATSECTSLASWGRNLLMEQLISQANNSLHGCLTVKPIDSLSTRATPAPPLLDCEQRTSSYFLFDKSSSTSCFNNAKAPILASTSTDVSAQPECIHSPIDDIRLSLSPPVHPPPPLPKFLSPTEIRRDEPANEVSVQPGLTPKPPPLPPRRAAAMLPLAVQPDEPSPVSEEQLCTNSFTATCVNDVALSPTVNKINGKVICSKRLAPTLESGHQPVFQQLLQQSNSLSPKRNASETCSAEDNRKFVKNPVFFDDYGMKRGHAKTNSLDRGLSLAKSMKSGPFPPPASSKSSSLKRDITPNDAMASVCEEDQRNSTAHGVIQQLTFSVLSSASQNKSEKKFSTNKCLAAVGEEVASASSSTSIPHLTPNAKLQTSTNPHYENLTICDNTKAESALENTINKQSLTIRSPSEKENEPCASVEDKQQSPRSSYLMRAPSKNSTLSLRKSKTLQHMESIDPVTKDVQRRMSLSSADSLQDEQANTFASINQLKTVARSYGTAAVGFLRSAVRLSKTAVTSNPIVKVLTTQNGIEHGNAEMGNSSDSGDDENTTSISESLPPTMCAETKMSFNQTPIVAATTPEVICRSRNTKKGPFDFEQLHLAQELSNEHTGAVWCVKFSVCGRLFATGGQDNIIRVWVLKNYVHYFSRMRERYSRSSDGSASQHSLQEKLSNFMFMGDHFDNAQDDTRSNEANDSQSLGSPSERASAAGSFMAETDCSSVSSSSPSSVLVMQKPFCVFRGHTADVLDLSWSPRNYFLLSCGIDRTVKLWHLTRNECLCCFQHIDFVTCIAFMPKDDRYFISGCMDGKIRLWHIPEKKVALWNEVEQSKFITAITFVRNAKFVVVGTYNGRCFFYTTDQLRYHTVIDVRSSRGKNAQGHKITSLAVHGDKLLITSNDSRIRMYDLRDMNLTRKFKGAQIERSQIRASFSPDGRHIISGSEDNYIYIWRTGELPPSISVRKDRNPMWERARAHNSVVTAAVFAPKPNVFFPMMESITSHLNQDTTRVQLLKNAISQQTSVRGSRSRRSTSIASSSGIGLDSSRSTTSGSVHKRPMNLSDLPTGNSSSLSTNFTSSLLSGSLSATRNDGEKLSRLMKGKKNRDAIASVALTSIVSGAPTEVSSDGVYNGRANNNSSALTQMYGDVIVSADVSGSLKIFLNPVPLKAGSSSFFPR